MRAAEIVLILDLAADLVVELSDTLEVSLDCSHCERVMRTVIFRAGEPTARCCPGSGARAGVKHPPYPGRLVGTQVERSATSVRATYRLEYDVAPFEDAQYGSERRPWTGHPTWSRVGFTLGCRCGVKVKESVQTNTTRPFGRRCQCGATLYVERREMPLLRWLDPGTGSWCQVEARFPPEETVTT